MLLIKVNELNVVGGRIAFENQFFCLRMRGSVREGQLPKLRRRPPGHQATKII